MAGYASAMSKPMTSKNSKSGQPAAKKGRPNYESPQKTGHKKAKQRIPTPALKTYDGGS